MPSVDDRIIRLEFDNSSFERSVSETLASLKTLDEALKLEGAQQGLTDVGVAADNLDLSHIATAVDSIAGKFTALGAIGFSVIQSLTQGALGFVKQVGGNIFDQILGGGRQRATNIENAKFQFRGLGIDVDKAMASALDAVKGTAFGLDEAAKAAAQFGASGIGAGKDMTQALRAIAGTAAMTNTSFSEIAQIFTSSAALGKVTNIDLQQFATRGLNATAALAKQLHLTQAQVVEMASAGKLSFSIFSKAMDDAFGAHATQANETFTGALANMKAALSRLGASFFGDQLTQQRDLFNALTPVIDDVTKALKPLIDAMLAITKLTSGAFISKLKGLDLSALKTSIPFIARGLLNAFDALWRVLVIVRTAFRDIFPKPAVSTLLKISIMFRKFTDSLKIGLQAGGKLRRILDGVFSAFSIGWTVLKETVKLFLGIGKAIVAAFGPSVVRFLVRVADFVTKLQRSLVKGGGIKDFFKGLEDNLKDLVPILQSVVDWFGNLFGKFDSKGADAVSGSMGRVKDRFKSINDFFRENPIVRFLEDAFKKVVEITKKIWDVLSNFFATLGHEIASTMGRGSFNEVLDVLNTAFLGGIVLLIAKFVKHGLKFDIGGNIFAKIGGAIDQLTGVLKNLQLQLKAAALEKIAIAIAILTGSLVVLSLIDSAALSKALLAISVGFGQLIGTFAALQAISKGTSAVKFNAIAIGLGILAGAMIVLSGAVLILSTMNWEQLSRGLSGLTVLLGIVVGTAVLLSKHATSLIAIGTGLLILAIGIDILTGAVKVLSTLDWEQLGKGMAAVTTLLGIFAGLSAIPIEASASLVVLGSGIFIIANALVIMAGALKLFGMMDWPTIGTGLVAIAGALVAIAIGMSLMPPTILITGAGLIQVGIALNIIAKALKSFGGMSWVEIGKGLTVLATSLLILAVGLTAMIIALPGAIALVVAAHGLLVLAGVMKVMADLSWSDIAKGLLGIAAGMGVLGLAALLLQPAILPLLGMSAALIIFGGAVALFGVGIFLIAKGLEAIAKSGKEAAAVIPSILESIGETFGSLARGITKGFLESIDLVGKFAPRIATAVGKLIGAILDQLIILIPKIKKTIEKLIQAGLDVVDDKADDIIATGFKLLITFLSGIRDNIEEITRLVGEIIVKFLKEFKKQVDPITVALVDLFVEIILSVTEQLGEKTVTLTPEIGKAFMRGIINGLNEEIPGFSQFFTELPGKILGWIGDAASWLWGTGWAILAGLYNGVLSFVGVVKDWFAALPGKVASWIGNVARWLWDKGWDLIEGLYTGITDRWKDAISWIKDIPQKIIDAFPNAINLLVELGKTIMQGLKNGMETGWNKAKEWLGKLNPATWFNDINLQKGHAEKNLIPTGKMVLKGLQNGMEAGWSEVQTWLSTLDPSKSINTDGMNNAIKAVNASVSQIEDVNPTITPVLDLTQVTSQAATLGAIFADPTLTPAFSLSQANTIASDTNAQKEAASAESATTPSRVEFNQTINAPEQLSTVDIYKQTRNQIAMAKEELKIP